MTSLTAYLTGGGGQTTQYLFGVTVGSGSAIESNDVVSATRWPDPSTGAASSGQQETTTVNAFGQPVTMTDRNGSVHTLSYDILGRVVSDAVTTLGSGVDGAVRRIETAYDEQGNAHKVTSYDAASSGNVVNEVLRTFNGLGQLTAEYQSHSGAVNTGTSPKVQYAWSEMPSSANHSRLTSITYPDGYVLTYNYASGLNSTISRLSSLSDSSGTVEGYEYLGLGGVVVRSHPQPNVDLTYVKRSGESVADAGDQYTGLDRFGRVVDQRWLDPTSGTATDRFQYGYDILGNRLYRDNLVNTAFGELHAYDAMNQLVSFDRGTLNGPKTGLTGAASRAQDWDYDAVGNFDSVTTNGTAQNRTANAQNEITSIGGATTPTYDNNGNMTGDETGKLFVYDAWNRMVIVKNSGGTTLKTYGYDGLNRRVTETASGTTTDLFYSTDWQVLTEKVGSNTTQRYVWSPVYVDAMVLRDRDTNADGTLDERLLVQQDANWNVTALVNGSGVVVERYVYDAFGVQSVYNASWSSIGGSVYSWSSGFQGMFFDSTAGLSNQRLRWYSPTLGRWVTIDPIGYSAQDVNLYRFVINNPTGGTDSLGLFSSITAFGLSTIFNRVDRSADILKLFDDKDLEAFALLVKRQLSNPLTYAEYRALKLIAAIPPQFAKGEAIQTMQRYARDRLVKVDSAMLILYDMQYIMTYVREAQKSAGVNQVACGPSAFLTPQLGGLLQNATTQATVTTLVSDLGSNRFDRREDAQAALLKLGKTLINANDRLILQRYLVNAMRNSDDPEVRARARLIYTTLKIIEEQSPLRK